MIPKRCTRAGDIAPMTSGAGGRGRPDLGQTGAERRDEHAQERARDSTSEARAGNPRARDEAAKERDRVSAARDLTGEERDTFAAAIDAEVDRLERVRALGNGGPLTNEQILRWAARERERGAHSRHRAMIQRKAAASDRGHAASDRLQAALDREASGGDRASARADESVVDEVVAALEVTII
jgi:hypothetical protein